MATQLNSCSSKSANKPSLTIPSIIPLTHQAHPGLLVIFCNWEPAPLSEWWPLSTHRRQSILAVYLVQLEPMGLRNTLVTYSEMAIEGEDKVKGKIKKSDNAWSPVQRPNYTMALGSCLGNSCVRASVNIAVRHMLLAVREPGCCEHLCAQCETPKTWDCHQVTVYKGGNSCVNFKQHLGLSLDTYP